MSSDETSPTTKPAEPMTQFSRGVRLQQGWMAKNGIGPSDTPTKLTDLPKKTSIIMWPISWPTNPAAAPSANQA